VLVRRRLRSVSPKRWDKNISWGPLLVNLGRVPAQVGHSSYGMHRRPQLAKYRLDDLGWFHFERLVQSLLKADIGLGVESWGGRGDFGRDAFASSVLFFPDRSVRQAGPFVFQIKFVDAANAGGTQWRTALLGAIKAEIARIANRQSQSGWVEPLHYILLTNCPLTAAARSANGDALRPVLPGCNIVQLGSSDISDLLDSHPNLRRSYPEILSLRDLNLLLAEAVSKQVLERSRAAVEESRDLIPVFVATSAYYRARRVLGKHFFVVLDGPPEMGKTAIARTIALGYLTEDWEVIDCRGPDDFFSAFVHDRRQLFVADDAFGRTEYDPVLGRMWERDLGRILGYLSPQHRLIWTSRKHILSRALKDLDLTGRAARFPEPGEVIVRADSLTTEEKARILYRHAKSSQLPLEAKGLVRDHAPMIVEDEHFTPERIRRFVGDVLPALPREASMGNEAVLLAVRRAIRDPTERMRKSLRKLPDDHRWILNCLLEEDGAVTPRALWGIVRVYRPSLSEEGFRDALADLVGTFLKEHRSQPWSSEGVDWIHPSYRDAVIEQLSSSPDWLEAFLRQASVRGIALAVSSSGGIEGERSMPFLRTPAARAIVQSRALEMTAESSRVTVDLLEVLNDAASTTETEEGTWIRSLLSAVCRSLGEAWARGDLGFQLGLVKGYVRAAARLDEHLPLPSIDDAWAESAAEMETDLFEENLPESEVLDHWREIVDLIETSYPTLGSSQAFVERRNGIESLLFERAEVQAGGGPDYSDPETNRRRARELETLADSLGPLADNGDRERTIGRLQALAEDYRAAAHEDDDERYEYEDSDRRGRPSVLPFDIKGLFEDL